MSAYYNEIDPYAAQWLKNLIAAGQIAPGEVDTRSIEDVRADDLQGFTQCHFFAGIGGWSHALRLAGWDDSRPVWTGSCPCQPFSVAGRGAGTADERHLWPAWFNLIRECHPKTVFGEQVEAAIRHGWLDLVQADLEGVGYATAEACVPAGVFAPHIRQRLWFVAHHHHQGLEGRKQLRECATELTVGSGGLVDELADAQRWPAERHGQQVGDTARSVQREARQQRVRPNPWDGSEFVYCRDDKWRQIEPGTFPLVDGVSNRVGRIRAYGNAIVPQVAAEVIGAFMEIDHATPV